MPLTLLHLSPSPFSFAFTPASQHAFTPGLASLERSYAPPSLWHAYAPHQGPSTYTRLAWGTASRDTAWASTPPCQRHARRHLACGSPTPPSRGLGQHATPGPKPAYTSLALPKAQPATSTPWRAYTPHQAPRMSQNQGHLLSHCGYAWRTTARPSPLRRAAWPRRARPARSPIPTRTPTARSRNSNAPCTPFRSPYTLL